MPNNDMFGCSKEELLEVCENAQQPYMGGLTMLAMSILSDAQECIAVGRNDMARQFINRAKFVISQNKSNIGLTN
jgi:hypothetical protein